MFGFEKNLNREKIDVDMRLHFINWNYNKMITIGIFLKIFHLNVRGTLIFISFLRFPVRGSCSVRPLISDGMVALLGVAE